jgi:ATP-dependent protease ClpP protease subunit
MVNTSHWAAAALIATVFFIAPQCQAQSTRVIQRDNGGSVEKYLMDTSLATLRGDSIRIVGWCASACTLYLGVGNTCVTRNATFAFHAPRGGTRSQNIQATELLAKRLPAPLGRWYLDNAAHLTGQRYLVLTGEEIVQMGAGRYC